MELFDHFKKTTLCPFASNSKIERMFHWDTSLTFIDNVKMHANSLKQFTHIAESEKFHGFVSRIFIGGGFESIEKTKAAFKDYLYGLADFDKDCFACLAKEKRDISWQFSFNNLRMFLNVFSPCYDRSHSKYLPSKHSIYIFFQPEYSFGLCGTRGLDRSVKESIRKRFNKAGKGYDGVMIDQRIESLLYLFPMKMGDPPIAWWE